MRPKACGVAMDGREQHPNDAERAVIFSEDPRGHCRQQSAGLPARTSGTVCHELARGGPKRKLVLGAPPPAGFARVSRADRRETAAHASRGLQPHLGGHPRRAQEPLRHFRQDGRKWRRGRSGGLHPEDAAASCGAAQEPDLRPRPGNGLPPRPGPPPQHRPLARTTRMRPGREAPDKIPTASCAGCCPRGPISADALSRTSATSPGS